MAVTEAFSGSPWDTETTDEWNEPTYWHDYYSKLLLEGDPWRRDQLIHRPAEPLIQMLTRAGELPRTTPCRLLDAGCGISLTPWLLSHWGFDVTAIDSCPLAITEAYRLDPDEEDLARCVQVWESGPRSQGYILSEDPKRSLQRLRGYRSKEGSLAYFRRDWFDEALPRGSFGVIHCRNALRCSTKPYWRRSLLRFRELLAPCGMLLLENVNAGGIPCEVERLLNECRFIPLHRAEETDPDRRYVIARWPTG